VSDADTTAVRERHGLYHATCWLGLASAQPADAGQLTPR
jgi:hypothetical protein